MDNLPFYGEIKCSAKYSTGKKKDDPCENGAYYITNEGNLRCGVHSKKNQRKELKKNAKVIEEKKEEDIANLIKSCMNESKERRNENIPGQVACGKFMMRRAIPGKEFHIPVLPNFKHDKRTDAIGCKTLSPMFLGPVIHNQPEVKDEKIIGNLPPALNLENFWQGSKVFNFEIIQNKCEEDPLEILKSKLDTEKEELENIKCDKIIGRNNFKGILGDEDEIEITIEDKNKKGRSKKNIDDFDQEDTEIPESKVPRIDQIKDLFFENQKLWFLDSTPHRHKSKELCHGWLWTRKDGSQKLFKYVESRQFYCNFYERLVVKEKEYKRLKNLVKKGLNLIIIGYDGLDIEDYGKKTDTFKEKIEKLYLDRTRPFGHELCLVTMLAFENPEDYPWRKYKTEEF
tara:strand:+ start:1665 stop:2864 length:1200 start_codon:yes stop_codon:yes gene_type:complete